MTTKQALAKLKSLGTAQTRKTYGRHGVSGEMYGVKFGDLYQLVKEIKTDHKLSIMWPVVDVDLAIACLRSFECDQTTLPSYSCGAGRDIGTRGDKGTVRVEQ